MYRKSAAEFIYHIVILLFTYAGLQKIMQVDVFRQQLQSMPLLKTGAGMLAWMLPLTEFFIVLLLFFAQTRRTGLICAFTLLLIMTVYLVYMILGATHLPCPCGGIISKLSWKQHLLLNSGLILLILFSLKNIVHKPLFFSAAKTGKVEKA
jgi:uncharacterized membrane protein YphA (DoxX/SURF4 family)